MSTLSELARHAAPAEPDPAVLAAAAEAASRRAALRLIPAPDAPAAEPVDFDDFVRRHTPRLRRQLMRKLGDISESEEIAQETLLRAHQHLHTLATEDELIAWTTVVGQRLAIDRLRVRGRSVAVAEVPEDSRVGRDTAEIVVARAEARTALEALEAIPERQAAILWAREVEGLHYDAIAERFGITEPAVRSLLHRGRRALRQEYAARGGTLPLRGLFPLAPGLIALRGLGRLRDAARSTVKANSAAFASLSIAGALALGISVGTGAAPWSPRPEAALGTDRVTAQTFGQPVTAPGDVRAAELGVADEASPEADAPRHKTLAASLPGDCSGNTASDPRHVCVGQSEMRGDVLYIGPELPTNPVAERVSVSQNWIGVCHIAPATPVTECSPGSARTRPSPSGARNAAAELSRALEGAAQ